MAPWAAFKLGLAEGAGRGIVNGLTIVSFYLVRQGCFGQCVIIPEVDAQGNSMVPKIKHYLLYDAVTSHDGSTKHYSIRPMVLFNGWIERQHSNKRRD
jgi:hypothetical protein